jgi:hemerythrin-like domain-containing protein
MTRGDLLMERRRMMDNVLDILEELIAKLNAGEPLPNVLLSDVVEFFRQFEGEVHETNEACQGTSVRSTPETDDRCAILNRMQWALESLERGEAGAVGEFVMTAREYVQRQREHTRLDDPLFPVGSPVFPLHRECGTVAEQMGDWGVTPEELAVQRHCARLRERYARLHVDRR